MNKILTILVAGVALFIMSTTKFLDSCYKKTSHEYTGYLDVSKDYVLNETGAFTKIATITRDDILRAFDIARDAYRLKAEIQELAVHVTIQSGNTAVGLVLTGTVNDGYYSSAADTLFKDFPVALVEVGIPGTIFTTNINDLIQRGIGRLKQNLTDFIGKNSSLDYSRTTIYLSGYPTNGRAVLTVSIKIKASLSYALCEQSPIIFGGDECGPGQVPPY